MRLSLAITGSSAISRLGAGGSLGGGVDAASVHLPPAFPAPSSLPTPGPSPTGFQTLGGEAVSIGDTSFSTAPTFPHAAATIAREGESTALPSPRSRDSSTPVQIAGADMPYGSDFDPFDGGVRSASKMLLSVNTFAEIYREATSPLVLVKPNPEFAHHPAPSISLERGSLGADATAHAVAAPESTLAALLGSSLAILALAHRAIRAFGSRHPS